MIVWESGRVEQKQLFGLSQGEKEQVHLDDVSEA